MATGGFPALKLDSNDMNQCYGKSGAESSMTRIVRRVVQLQPLVMFCLGICVAIAAIISIIWNTQVKTAAVERKTDFVAAQIPVLRAEAEKDKGEFLRQHGITHDKLAEVKRTQEHIMRQQDIDTKQLEEIRHRVK